MFFLPGARKYISPDHKTDFIDEMVSVIQTAQRYVDEGMFGDIAAGDDDEEIRESIAYMCEDMFFLEGDDEREVYDFVDFAILYLQLPEFRKNSQEKDEDSLD